MEGLTEEQLAEIKRRLEREVAEFRLADYRPYKPQAIFHARGLTHRERLLLAPNQTGKTLCACAEIAYHLTGRYPEGWIGRRWNRPIRGTGGSESAELTRKGTQRLLVGPPEVEAQWGTGMIPKRDLLDWSRRTCVPNTLDSIVVQHYDEGGSKDGESVHQFASYEQGPGKWASDTLDIAHFDEEPPEPVYMEGMTRTNVGQGSVIITATPLNGMSAVIMRFYPQPQFPGAALIQMTLDDAKHYTPEERKAIIASYPEHEKGPRAFGIPGAGSGLIFPVSDESISVEAFHIPDFWPRIAGVDFGFDHPAASVWLAWDRDADVVYVYDCHKEQKLSPMMHAGILRSRGQWIPVAWPHDGENETQAGEALSQQFSSHGANMRKERAAFPEGYKGTEKSRISVEAGLMEMLDRMQTGRFKVFSHLDSWFQEKRLYHRDKGKVVKQFDDILSATRVGIMDLRFARTRPVKSFHNAPRAQMLDPEVGY